MAKLGIISDDYKSFLVFFVKKIGGGKVLIINML